MCLSDPYPNLYPTFGWRWPPNYRSRWYTLLMDPKKEEPKDVPDEKSPQQQLGDTPVAPWEMPTPEEKAKAEPVRQALESAVEKVDTPEKADRVAENLEHMAGERTSGDVEQAEKAKQEARGGDPLQQSAQDVKQASQQPASQTQKTSDVIAETVSKIEG